MLPVFFRRTTRLRLESLSTPPAPPSCNCRAKVPLAAMQMAVGYNTVGRKYPKGAADDDGFYGFLSGSNFRDGFLLCMESNVYRPRNRISTQTSSTP